MTPLEQALVDLFESWSLCDEDGPIGRRGLQDLAQDVIRAVEPVVRARLNQALQKLVEDS